MGPLGVELKKNIKDLWWKAMVYDRDDVYGLDSTIIHHPKVWEASGHATSFIDPLRECKACHQRFREDKLKSDKCPECGGKLTEVRQFNLMFKTSVGPVEEGGQETYLRPETCQGIFINFGNVIDSCHPKIPFGIAQIGKGFRNEITTGDFIFRDREFEMMELEFFVKPDEDERWFEYWKGQRMEWYQSLGIRKENLRFFEHPKEALAHYSKRTIDIEYKFPFSAKGGPGFDGGWAELEGVANRTDFDLKNHSKFSGRDLSYQNEETGEKYYPYVIEPSVGVERIILALLLDSYKEEKERVILSLAAKLAPYKAAVFPLLANKPELVKKARSIFDVLRLVLHTAWDERGNIGKRYYTQDEVGTPWCVTIDFQTLEDETVTVRDRDTTKQERVKVDKLKDWFERKLR